MLFKTLLPFVVAALAVGAHPVTPEEVPPQAMDAAPQPVHDAASRVPRQVLPSPSSEQGGHGRAIPPMIKPDHERRQVDPEHQASNATTKAPVQPQNATMPAQEQQKGKVPSKAKELPVHPPIEARHEPNAPVKDLPVHPPVEARNVPTPPKELPIHPPVEPRHEPHTPVDELPVHPPVESRQEDDAEGPENPAESVPPKAPVQPGEAPEAAQDKGDDEDTKSEESVAPETPAGAVIPKAQSLKPVRR
ncbi:hypothetical protein CPB86DRAFT_782655 [Serendipita vermifera]|nr:hypothetical protein CPB86DRAFT_782655 [Serendipita vermifera]